MPSFSFKRPHVKGTDLSPLQRRIALAQYVHRYTLEHKPAWANKPREVTDDQGRVTQAAYAPLFASDADWLANTLFNVKKDGTLAQADCWSSPTWPLKGIANA
jgi:hypothetical protein